MNPSPAGAIARPHGPPPKRRIRNYLLDPRFQLKYTSIIVVIAIVLMAGLGFVIMLTANTAAAQAHAASGEARSAAAQADRAMRESQTSSRIMRMNQLMGASDNPELVHTIEQQLAEDDRLASRNLDEVRRQRVVIDQEGAQIEQTRRRTFYTLVGTGIGLVLLLGLVGIVITHRVVGPVFKLKRLLRLVGQGRLDIKERLRRGDELEDLFDTFLAMVNSLRDAQERELERLEVAINEIETAGTAPGALEKLRELRAEMRLALGSPESDYPR